MKRFILIVEKRSDENIGGLYEDNFVTQKREYFDIKVRDFLTGKIYTLDVLQGVKALPILDGHKAKIVNNETLKKILCR